MDVLATHQTGRIGITGASNHFERIGWGVQENSHHDFGIDLLLFPRERAGDNYRDLAMLASAQVKGGASYFREPIVDQHGLVNGWVFRKATRKHLQYWLALTTPHLLILHDADADISYWAQVTRDAVTTTDKGWKITVPADQRIDHDGLVKLLDVADRSRPTSLALEGSSWNAEAAVGTSPALWRKAVCIPRLVAPHRNKGFVHPIGPAAAVALLLDGRFADLARFSSKHPSVPDPEHEALDSDNPAWRLLGAMVRFVTTDEIGPLIAAAAQASADEATAAHVLAAAALGRTSQYAAAEQLIGDRIDHDAGRRDSLDRAWLFAHRAEHRTQLGEFDGARDDIGQALLLASGDDVVARGLRASATSLLWRLSSNYSAEGLAEVLRATDTLPVWWRSVRLGSAATSRIAEEFAAMDSLDQSVALGASDATMPALFAAARTAEAFADGSAHAGAEALLAKYRFIIGSAAGDDEEVRHAVADLVWSGDRKAVAVACRRLWAEGPIGPLVALSERTLDTTAWTTRSAHANVELFKSSGDVLPGGLAAEAVAVCVAIIDGSFALPRRQVGNWWKVTPAVLEAIAELLPGATDESHKLAVATLNAVVDAGSMSAFTWRAVAGTVSALRWEALDKEHRASVRRIGAVAVSAEPVQANAILDVLVNHGDADAVASLLRRATDERDVDASVRLTAAGHLPIEQVPQLVGVLAHRLKTAVEDAARGRFSGNVQDLGGALAWLNTEHPDAASWDHLLTFLTDPNVTWWQKSEAVTELTASADRVPDDIRQRLVAAADRLAGSQRVFLPYPQVSPAATIAGLLTALGAGDPEEVRRTVTRLTWSGVADDRVGAMRLISRASNLLAADVRMPIVAAGCHDRHPRVRAWAAAALASDVDLLHQTLTRDIIQQLIDEPGVLVPLAIANNIARSGGLPWIDDVVTQLTLHPSQKVRLGIAGSGS